MAPAEQRARALAGLALPAGVEPEFGVGPQDALLGQGHVLELVCVERPGAPRVSAAMRDVVQPAVPLACWVAASPGVAPE